MPDGASKLPVLGRTPKPALIAAVVVAAGVGIYVMHKKSAASTTSSTGAAYGYGGNTYGYSPGSVPVGEYGYGSDYGYGLGSYSYNAYGQTAYPGVGSQNPVYGPTPVVATNAEWAQACESYLGTNGYNPITVAAALGKYLTGAQVTANQQGVIEAAIAFQGYPPSDGANNYPPSIKTAPSTGQGGGGHHHGKKEQITTGKGETLSDIAHDHGTTGGNLVKLNVWLAPYYGDKRKVPAGRKITIP